MKKIANSFWKILGASVLLHVLLICLFKGVVLLEKPRPHKSSGSFFVVEIPSERKNPDGSPVMERRYHISSEILDPANQANSNARLQAQNPDRTEDTNDPASRLFDQYLAESRGARGFFGYKPNGSSVVFLIDISGSMLQQTGTQTRLSQAYDELKQALTALEPSQTFNIILFASRVDTLAPKPLAANRRNLVSAYRYLDADVDCGGKTNLQDGLRAAIDMDPDVLVLLSDGIPTGSEHHSLLTEIRYLREKTDRKMQIHTIGFYISAGSDEDRFLSKLASENNGTYSRWNPRLKVSGNL